MTVNGTVLDGFEAVRDAFGQAQASDEGAAQLAVYYQGQLVVDLWTGRDAIGGRPHTGDSISILMSVSKGMTATCVHLLGQRGLLDVDASVARYWPEFAGNGKQRVTVRHVLTHSSGLFGFPSRRISVPANCSTGTAASRCWPRWRRYGSRVPPSPTTR